MIQEPERASWQDRWRAFERLDHLRNHWYWRPGWRLGRSFYTWHCTFEAAGDLHRLVHRVQAALSVPSLDPVPQDGLHLTVQGLGFTDEVTDPDVEAIADAVAARCAVLPAFDITIGPVDPDEEGIGLLISPWRPLLQLRSTIRSAIATVWSEVPETEEFRPHVTVAYTNSDAPAGPVRQQLAPLRDLAPAVVRVASVQLIRLNRDAGIYRWEPHREVRLGTA